MEKIIVAVNGHQINIPAIEFACSIAQLTGSKLTGMIIEERNAKIISNEQQKSYHHDSDAGNLSSKELLKADMDKTVYLFKDICERKGVIGEVHRAKDAPLEKIILKAVLQIY